MSGMPITTDVHGDRYAAVHVEELDEWAWLLAQLEDWLLHASEETISDWDSFTGPFGPGAEQVIYVLGHWSVRMRNLAEGRA